MVRKQIDAKTKTMSDAALACRALGHGMVEKPVPRGRELELQQLGQYEERLVCFRACGRWRNDIRDAVTDELIGRTGNYIDKESYLVQGDGGRLSRSAAMGAHRARQRRARRAAA